MYGLPAFLCVNELFLIFYIHIQLKLGSCPCYTFLQTSVGYSIRSIFKSGRILCNNSLHNWILHDLAKQEIIGICLILPMLSDLFPCLPFIHCLSFSANHCQEKLLYFSEILLLFLLYTDFRQNYNKFENLSPGIFILISVFRCHIHNM